jgi:prolyl-tRNA editing enzyme YbaK/EbsC (Cys-tRNA(Pro) deacylase)
MKTIVDTTLAQVEHIWFDGNSYHEAIGMKFEDFRRLEKPKVGAFVADG